MEENGSNDNQKSVFSNNLEQRIFNEVNKFSQIGKKQTTDCVFLDCACESLIFERETEN